MSGKTEISWTDRVWNPTVGCARVSAGCDHCYAFALHDRRHLAWKRGRWPSAPVQYHQPFSRVQLLPDRLTDPLHWRKPSRIFVDSMADLFHEDVPFDYIDRVFAVMALSPQHTFQVLTKRPERMREYVSATALPPPEKGMGPIHRASKVLWAAQRMADDRQLPPRMPYPWSGDFAGGEPLNWPLPNVWLGTSAEDQERADQRYQPMRDLAQAGWFTWVSAEPLLSDVNVMPWLRFAVGWLVVGGESGPGARSCDVEWIRSIVRQCQAAGVAVFVKQLGSKPLCVDRELWERDGRSWETIEPTGARVPMKMRDPKGGEMWEWAEDLRVREFPGGQP